MRRRPVVVRGPCAEIPGSPFFRSTWERNVYRAFLAMGFTEVRYEPITYKFEKPYLRALDYKVDFTFVDGKGRLRLCEIKGHFDARSRTRLKGFAKYYPHLLPKMLIITEVNRPIKIGKGKKARRQRAHEWITENLPGAEAWDYRSVEQIVGALVAWEKRGGNKK